MKGYYRTKIGQGAELLEKALEGGFKDSERVTKETVDRLVLEIVPMVGAQNASTLAASIVALEVSGVLEPVLEDGRKQPKAWIIHHRSDHAVVDQGDPMKQFSAADARRLRKLAQELSGFSLEQKFEAFLEKWSGRPT